MSVGPAQRVDEFLDLAVEGSSKAAIDLVLRLLDDLVPSGTIISELLVPVQREVGARWQRDELSVADEHLATGVTESALHALVGVDAVPAKTGLVVLACAEGDWHALASRMFAEQLRSRGVVVAFLGASTPADQIATFVRRHRPEALAVSCTSALFYTGVPPLADAAHAAGIPVLVGGRALSGQPDRSRRLGADAEPDDADAAITILDDWREHPPVVRVDPTPLPADALELDRRAGELGEVAFGELARRFSPMATYDDRQIARTREDLAYIVRYVAAAHLVDDPAVFTSFLDWLLEVLAPRGVPRGAVAASLDVLQPLVGEVSRAGGHLITIGRQHLEDTG
ncbi:MAG: cobalamin-dependent protein [Acidimicrobiales bacterium]|nr:cobalamin-dependent protein [Acidimicrobiales bacterium]